MSSLPERSSSGAVADLRPAPGRVRARPGVHLWDAHGREYLDFLGGIAVVAAGHAHLEGRGGGDAQLGTGHTSTCTSPAAGGAGRTPGRPVRRRRQGVPVQLGAEANEAAIKVARRWGRANRGSRPPASWPVPGRLPRPHPGHPGRHRQARDAPPFQPLPAGFSMFRLRPRRAGRGHRAGHGGGAGRADPGRGRHPGAAPATCGRSELTRGPGSC